MQTRTSTAARKSLRLELLVSNEINYRKENNSDSLVIQVAKLLDIDLLMLDNDFRFQMADDSRGAAMDGVKRRRILPTFLERCTFLHEFVRQS